MPVEEVGVAVDSSAGEDEVASSQAASLTRRKAVAVRRKKPEGVRRKSLVTATSRSGSINTQHFLESQVKLFLYGWTSFYTILR